MYVIKLKQLLSLIFATLLFLVFIEQCFTALLLVKRQAPYCEAVHDGIMCWPRTLPGQRVAQPCPPMLGFNEEKYVYRKCSVSGLWENFNDSSVVIEKTNYESCIPSQLTQSQEQGSDYILQLEDVIRKTSILGITFIMLSLVSIFISVLIYKFVLPKYINDILRVKIHKHLFGAVTFEMLIKLIFQISIFLQINHSVSALFHKPILCEVLTTFNQYFEITILLWIVIDCHFIHITARSGFLCISGYKTYIIIGWGTPLIPVLIWTMTLIMSHKVTCWQGHMTLPSIWIVEVPKILCFVAIVVLICMSSYRHYHTVSQRLIPDGKVVNNITTTAVLFALMLLSFLVVTIPTHVRIANLQQRVAVQYLATILTCSKGIYLALLCNYSNIKDYIKREPSSVDIEI